MITEQRIEKGVSEIVGVLTDPIVVHRGGWMDIVPDWLKQAIQLERLTENVRALKEGDMTGSDAEACAYLHTASLEFPLDHDWTEIYLYVAGKVYERHRTKESGARMPEDIRVESLTRDQERDLARLKHWIYEKRVADRQERARGERRERREQEAETKRREQPALFQL